MLRLELGGCSRSDIEDYAVDVQEAVDAHNESLGTAIRCLFDPMGLELIFTVDAVSVADVHREVASVVEAVEGTLPFRFDTETATTRSPERRELISA